MDNINDLLNLINSSSLSRKTDAQLVQQEQQVKWDKTRVQKLVDKYQNTDMSLEEFCTGEGLDRSLFRRLCKKWNIDVEHRVDKSKVAKKRGIAQIMKNPRHLDIINGMSVKEWTQKYNVHPSVYRSYRRVLRGQGLVD